MTRFKKINLPQKSKPIIFMAVFALLGGGYLAYKSLAAAACAGTVTTTSNFASNISAASSGATLCLASGNYGTWTGTSKAITIKAADGATPQMKVSFGSGDANFTIDGMAGMGGTVTSASSVTIKNSDFTSPIDFQGNNQNVVLDHNTFNWNAQSANGEGDTKINTDSTGTHSLSNPSVTIENNVITNGDLDGVRVGMVTGLLVLNNHFENLCDQNLNHTDNIQFYGESSQVRIAGNYVYESYSCGTQGITSYDGGTNGIIIENNVVDIGRPWGIELYADKNSIVRHNTVVYHPDSACFFNGLTCGQIDINRKSADPAGSGTHVYDNLAVVEFNNGSTGTADHNVSSQNAVYVGPTTSHDGFLLASSSPVGRNAASDGTNIGVYAIGEGGGSGGTPAPTVTVSASPSTINSGNSSTLSWSSANATSCSASGAWSGTKSTSGTASVSPASTSTYNLSCSGAGGTASASATVTVSSPVGTNCTTVGSGWAGGSFASQNGSFTVIFTASPGSAATDAAIGLANGAAGDYTDLGPIIRFNPDNHVDARNGSGYSAVNNFSYSAGSAYKVRMVVRVYNHTFDAYVAPSGGSETTIASNYAFRDEQASVNQLTNWGSTNPVSSHQVCDLVISNSAPPPGTKQGDINGDGSVNILDLSILLGNWNTSNSASDINKDGTVNILDLSVLLSNYGT
ncbi:MAG TPA: dockerin type I domain-containing protein [Candidatus Saccharimonadales bacterium]|nr:dockerin type I domain-containing protein [Candidatus Saccharimonadales bacterium]